MNRRFVKNRKKKNIVLIIFLVLFVVIGIGYSTLSTYLQIGGTVEVKKVIPVLPDNVIRATDENDTSAFRSDTYRDKIKTITLGDSISPPANIIESWDIGEAQSGDVMAYLTTNANDNTMYDLTIQGDGHLYANPNSSLLFYNLRYLDSINNIDCLDISLVTDMSMMFYNTGRSSSVFTLDLGNNFDTSNVTNMYGMFAYTGYQSPVFTLDLGDNFDTSNVTDMADMFVRTAYSNPNFTFDFGNKYYTSNVTDMSGIFSNFAIFSTK